MQIKTNNEILPHTCKNGYCQKKKQEITSWQGCVDNEKPKHCWWDSELVQPLWK